MVSNKDITFTNSRLPSSPTPLPLATRPELGRPLIGEYMYKFQIQYQMANMSHFGCRRFVQNFIRAWERAAQAGS